MSIMARLQSTSSQAVVQVKEPSEERSAVGHLAGRLIQITLALYLLPALLIVLLAGGVGILALRASRLFVTRRSAE